MARSSYGICVCTVGWSVDKNVIHSGSVIILLELLWREPKTAGCRAHHLDELTTLVECHLDLWHLHPAYWGRKPSFYRVHKREFHEFRELVIFLLGGAKYY